MCVLYVRVYLNIGPIYRKIYVDAIKYRRLKYSCCDNFPINSIRCENMHIALLIEIWLPSRYTMEMIGGCSLDVAPGLKTHITLKHVRLNT